MPFMDWIIILAIALLSVALLCGRSRACRSLSERTRQLLGIRLIVQATLALWAAPLIFPHGLIAPADLSSALSLSPRAALGIALALLIAGCQWLYRGSRLLRQQRMFRAW